MTSIATTLLPYADTDPTKLAVIDAMRAVLGLGHEAAAVSAKTTGTTLTLNAANYQLTFREEGPAVSHSPPSATSTITPTHS